VHRDIKPDNVMLSERHALVTDFGVAKAVSEATGAQKLTTEGVALGTPAYMSPEQAAADKHIDHRADIYAVGALAYEVLTGRPPFTGTTPQEVLAAHVTKAVEPVTEHRATVPPALAQLVMKCLEKKPADRWQTAEELVPHLEALATPSGGVTPTGMMPVDRVTKRRWMIAGGAVGVAAVIALIVVVAALPRGSGATLNSDRVVVAELRNGTGDPSLNPVGGMAGHWITQGLQQTQVLQVVPWETALQSSRYVQSEATAGRVVDPIRGLAEETGAGIVISGAYYLEGDSIQIHIDVNDAARGAPLGSIDPLWGSRDSPSEVLGDLQQQVMGFLAIRIDDRLAAPANLSGDPPPFEAYEAFAEGLDQYLVDFKSAQPHLHRAHELDRTWAEPLLFLVMSHIGLGEYARADSVLEAVWEMGETLTSYHRAYLEYTQAVVNGDNERGLAAIRRAAEMAPGSRAWYSYAYLSVRTNRPRQAIAALSTLDPDRGAMRGWAGYFIMLCRAYLALDESEKALEAARRLRVTFGDEPGTLALEALAQVGLGRVEEVNALLDDLHALPEQGLMQTSIVDIAVYLRRQGHIDAARTTVDRAIQWLEERLPEARSTEEWLWAYASALYVADRCDDAYNAAKQLSQEFAEDFASRGLVGLLAACRGDQEEAVEISHWLDSLDAQYLRGDNTAWRSLIAGALGDGESAVALWRQALAEGFAHPSIWWWGWIAFEPIRDYPPFQELMRPKG